MPGLFEQFPHTNLHELNLDWLINMINQFKEELENSAVLSVNGETGHVTLYESENVILPALPSGVDQWRLVRLMDGQYVGILFYNGHAYIQRGNETMRLLTLEDIPTSSGVVSWNGLTGVVNVTGQDIPIDDAADANSIQRALETERVNRTNADNALQNSINTNARDIDTINTNVANIGSFVNLGNRQGTGTFTLNESIRNFRFIFIKIGYYSTGYPQYGQALIPVSMIAIQSSNEYSIRIVTFDNSAGSSQILFTSETECNVVSIQTNTWYTAIYGIK